MIKFRMKGFSVAAGEVPKPGEVQQQVNEMALRGEQKQQEQPMSSKDLLIQQMRLQRQIIQTQQARQRMQQQERMQRIRQANLMQKAEQDDKTENTKNQIKIRKVQAEAEKSQDNTGLYKTKAKSTPPVPMKV